VMIKEGVLLLFLLHLHSTSSLHSIIVSTSVGPYESPRLQLATVQATIDSYSRAFTGVPIIVAADAVPTEQEIQSLPPVDADKWASLWREKRDAYENEYLPALQSYLSQLPSPSKLVCLDKFGHLIGTVRAGLDACGAGDDDVVLITQHDLQLAFEDTTIREDTPLIVESLSSGDSAAQYVLLNRDSNDAPRSAEWLCPQEADDDINLPFEACFTRFSDQTHFTRVSWYREFVLGACTEGERTCMEHQLNALHGGAGAGEGSPLDGSMLMYGGMKARPVLHDLVHGSMVRTDSRLLDGFAGFEPLGDAAASSSWTPHEFSVVVWDPATGRAKGALNYADGDASRPAAAIALPKAQQ
jgi:hypothetical protein